MHAFKKIVLFSAAVLASTSVFARDQIDDLVERMNPPKSLEDPRNSICAKDDRGYMLYSNHDVIQRAEKLNVQLALYKWGRLHFPNARDPQICPKLHYGYLTQRWRRAHDLPSTSITWDEDALKAFERLVEMPSRPSTVATNKSTDESSKSGSIEIFGLKMGEPFTMPDCDKTRYQGPCYGNGLGVVFADGRRPAMLRSSVNAVAHEGLLAMLDFEIGNDDETIAKFNQKFGKPRIEAKAIKNKYGVDGVLKIHRWISPAGVIRIDCKSLDATCQVYVTSQQYIKVLREKESQQQPL